MTRSTLTGDWGGWRDNLSKKGVTLDLDLVQTGQGVPTGGRNSAWEYNGEALYDFNVNFGKLGLWPGGFQDIRRKPVWAWSQPQHGCDRGRQYQRPVSGAERRDHDPEQRAIHPVFYRLVRGLWG